MVLAVGSVTHVGRVRAVNEDSVRVEDDLWVVADGLGGHEGGEHASRAAADTVVELTVPAEGGPSLVTAIEEAHRRVLALGRDVRAPDMGTTVVAAARDAARGEVTIAWVGDSRAYLVEDSGLRPLTEDHNEAAEMVRRGLLTSEASRTSPAQSWLTRCLGAGHPETPAVDTVTIPHRGRLMLCTDGLTEEVDEERIAEILAGGTSQRTGGTPQRTGGTPQQACDLLLAAALDAGGSDNVTIVVVDLAESSAGGADERG